MRSARPCQWPIASTRLRRKPKLLSTQLGTSLEHRRKQPRRRTLRNMGAEEPTHPHSTQGRRTDSWTPPALFRGSEDGTTEFRSRKPRTWVCSPAGSRDFRSAPPRPGRRALVPGVPRMEGAELRGRKRPGEPREAAPRALVAGGTGSEGAASPEEEEREGRRGARPALPKPEACPAVPLARATVEFSVSMV